MQRVQNLWVGGYRSFELQIFKDDDPKAKVIEDFLEMRLRDYCEKGLKWILTGAQLGIEQTTVRVAKRPIFQEYQLQTAVILPFEGMADRWNDQNKQRFSQTVQTTDYFNSVSHTGYQGPQQFKNWQQFMLSHTDGSFFVYDLDVPGKCQYEYMAITQYQKYHDYDCQLASFYDLQDFVNDRQEF
ncbi:SLOG family protein [Bombilactobacillus folatiphilus]|uniref:SLOG family protein n=1 Tax=Bombilactobacillus folatiphilus TaxID=2923362 RepID=A0ABY4P792_9LACO|nr:SLOG family protein [Bombilactobacillus folatiphilus]UQS81479.1 SLOG family protein [Bombilactobacillus folatiphilus]